MATDPPPAALPPPEEQLLLAAPKAPLLLAAPESRWKKHAKPITAIALAAFVVIAFAIGWFLHHRRAEAAEKANEAERSAIPLVSVVPVKRSSALSEMLLPGSLSPITEASLYARAAGYVKRRYVDIGDSVAKGQVLAVIESPELDQQLAQGQAAVAQAKQQLNQALAAVGDAKAKLDLTRITWQRYETLLQQDSIARQDVDQAKQAYESAAATLESARANVGAADENVRAAQANVLRLIALQGFEKVRAPFTGVITARSFDEGDLVSSSGAGQIGNASTQLPSLGSSSTSSGSSSTSTGTSSGSGTDTSGSAGSAGSAGLPLFRIAQDDRLRVYVSVPQDNAAAIQIGAEAQVFVQAFADRFAGRVARTARAIDPSSRTLLTEVQIGNGKHTLMPGMYAQVRFTSQRSDPPLLVPGEAVIVRARGTEVALLGPLDDDDKGKLPDQADARCARKVHLQPITIGRDYGTEVEITRGLKGGEFLLLSPGDTAVEGAFMLPQLHAEAGDESGAQGQAKGQGSGGSASSAGKGGSAAGQGGDAKKSDDKKAGDKKDKKGAKDDAQKQARQSARTTCIDEQFAAARAEHPPTTRPAPAGESPTTATAASAASAAASSAASGGTAPPAPTDADSLRPGGPSDRDPGGIQSPSIEAPSQGSKKPAGKGKPG